ncbi:maleylpyruvate isomerase family mycothiol-dependent enzyme [Williamsia sp. MIQD14]|uniref:maleylpyruvate isomerase family mycothiol-dependent enzyme n=1 Tax=Williamsia sp. MIQD14 TaxID=3425703 RepID=UPI003DA01E0D
MNRDDMFDAIAAERGELADVLDGLDDAQWATQSLCSEWTVRDVAGHLVMPLITGPMTIARTVFRVRGNLARANVVSSRKVAVDHRDELPSLLRAHAESHFTPPFGGPEAPLTDLLVHGQDIRRPLGLTRGFDPARLRVALDFLSTRGAFAFGASRADVTWVATDLDWRSGRAGAPEIRGPAEAVLLARAGRRVALADLTGDGLARVSPSG